MALSPQWEYLTFLVSEDMGLLGSPSSGVIHPYSVNGHVLPNWKKIDLNTFLSQLGVDHWEMTGSLSISGGNVGAAANYLFFKRMKP